MYCPLCKSKSKLYLDYKKIGKGDFKLLKCQRCKLIFTFPLPDKDFLADFYQSYDSIGQKDNYYRDINGCLKSNEKLFKKLEKKFNFNKNKPVLDLGSGNGVFLSILKRRGYQEQGIEISQSAVKFAQKNFNVNCEVGDAGGLDVETRFIASYGAVFMWDLLEHLPSQVKIIKKINKWLVDGGYLIMDTPNSQALINKIILGLLKIGIKWPAKWMFGFHHLFLHHKKSLVKLLEDNGFRVLKIEQENTSANRIFPWSIKYFFPRIMLEIINSLTCIIGSKNKLLLVAKKNEK